MSLKKVDGEMTGCESKNFNLLESRWPELYRHASMAERYVHDDPTTSVIKLRCFVESLVGHLHRELELPSEPGDGLFEKLKSKDFEAVVDSAIRQKLHAIRYRGNKAAHGGDIDADQALQLLKEAYFLGRWLFTTYSQDASGQYPEFVVPQLTTEINKKFNIGNELLEKQLEDARRELDEVKSAEIESQQTITNLSKTLDEARLLNFRNASIRATSSMDLEEENTRRLLNIEDAFNEYTLTEGQAELVNRLGGFLGSNTENVFLLRGYAGTGKTFITKGLTEYFRAIGRSYVLAAPTGKAAKVISEKTKSNASTIHRTIYSFKDVAEYRDHDLDGSETYKFYANLAVNELSADTVFIVDEASMIADVYTEAEFFRFGSGYLLSDFLKYVNLDHNDHLKKVIFIGDDAQLPPVGMSFSPALDQEYLSREHNVNSTGYELKEVVRQKAESGVMANSIMLRNALRKGVFNQLSVDFKVPDISSLSHSELINKYLESCGNKINGESIVIAYSNADVAAYNKRIREHFFPGCEKIAIGDKVMAVSNSSANGFFISNGDFGIIRDILGDTEQRQVTIKRKNQDTEVVERITITLAFRDVLIGFRDPDGNPKFFIAKILEDLLYSDQPSLSSDESKALYLDFCIRNSDLPRGSLEFKDTLRSDPYFNALRLKFGYAITCHKAQGSEWNNVFVKCKTNQNQLSAAYFRWFYTAITRTAQRLWLLDPPDIKPWSGMAPVSQPGFIGRAHSPNNEFSSSFSDEKVFQGGTQQGQKKETLDSSVGDVSDHGVSGSPTVPSKNFGIPSDSYFLIALLDRVMSLVSSVNIGVCDIVHNQYQEAYTFCRGHDFCRIDISYNGKEIVKRVSSPVASDLSDELQRLLSPIVGVPIAYDTKSSPDDFIFDQDFLNDLHQRIAPLVKKNGISIKDVKRYPWNLRYSFVRGEEIAVYDIYFDGKQRFTKFQCLITACSPGPLISDIEALLLQGLS